MAPHAWTRQQRPAPTDILLDIGDRRTDHATSNRLAAIVTSSDDAIVGKTLDGIVTDWNAGAEKIFGYTAAEMIGKPLAILLPPGQENEEEEILARIRDGRQDRSFRNPPPAQGWRDHRRLRHDIAGLGQ